MRELIGLSPLARGTRLRGSDTRRKAPVYPRWRGEHTKDILLFYNSFLSTQQFTNFITTISHY